MQLVISPLRLLGHQNHQQKIQHVVKIKQENVELKTEVGGDDGDVGDDNVDEDDDGDAGPAGDPADGGGAQGEEAGGQGRGEAAGGSGAPRLVLALMLYVLILVPIPVWS